MWPFTPKWESKDPEKRLKAIKKLNPNKPAQKMILEKISYNNNIYEARQLAFQILGKENSQDSLIDIAKNDKERQIRAAAFEKLSEQCALADIAKNANSDDIREAAVQKISDENVLADIAKNLDHLHFPDRHLSSREAAVKKIFNQELLANIAKNSIDKTVKIAASLKLTNLSMKTKHLIQLFEEYPENSEISGQLKDLYKQNLLSQSDKAKILRLTEQAFESHNDIIKYTDSSLCGDENGNYHRDNVKTIHFNL